MAARQFADGGNSWTDGEDDGVMLSDELHLTGLSLRVALTQDSKNSYSELGAEPTNLCPTFSSNICTRHHDSTISLDIFSACNGCLLC